MCPQQQHIKRRADCPVNPKVYITSMHKQGVCAVIVCFPSSTWTLICYTNSKAVNYRRDAVTNTSVSYLTINSRVCSLMTEHSSPKQAGMCGIRKGLLSSYHEGTAKQHNRPRAPITGQECKEFSGLSSMPTIALFGGMRSEMDFSFF